MAAGKGVRCTGFKSGPDYVYCSREQFAQMPGAEGLTLDTKVNPPAFRHYLAGDCHCGVNHTGRRGPNRAQSPQGGDPGVQRSRSGPQDAGRRAGDQEGPEQYHVKNSAPVAEFAYTDDPESGKTVAYHGRWEWMDASSPKGYDKTYRWRLAKQGWSKGGGGYLKGLGGKFGSNDPAPFGADLLLLQPMTEALVFVEGEPAALACRENGLFAVCWPGGGGQLEFPEEWLELARDRPVYLWPDNDKPGQDHMRGLRRALGNRPQFVAMLRPAVPPKGDAVDYFKAGGTVEDLLADVLTGPATIVESTRKLAVRIPVETGIIEFGFDNVETHRGSLKANLTLRVPNAMDEWEGEVTLASASSRNTLVTQLNGIYGKDFAWASMINTSFAALRKGWDDIDPFLWIGEMQEIERERFLIDELITDSATVWFGQGEALKSYLAEAAALALSVGYEDLLGFRVEKQMPVVVVDYEAPGTTARFHMRRLLLGERLDPLILPDLPIAFYDELRGEPLTAIARRIERFANKRDAGLIIVNSADKACPEPEFGGPTNEFFAALAYIGLPALVIAHMSKQEEERARNDQRLRPAGHRQWENTPRRTIHFERTSAPGADIVDLVLTVQKSNLKRPSPVGVEFEFTGDNGAVYVRPKSTRRMEGYQAPARIQVLELMMESPPKLLRDIASELGIQTDNASKLLRSMRRDFETDYDGGKGKTTYWYITEVGRERLREWRAGK